MNELVKTQTAIAKRRRPELVTVGEGRNQRLESSTHRFHIDLCGDLVARDTRRWFPVGELARTFYGSNSPSNREKVRRRMSLVFRWLLECKRAILVYEFDGRRIGAVKVFDASSEEDQQAIKPRLERMMRQRVITQEQWDKIESILQIEDVQEAK